RDTDLAFAGLRRARLLAGVVAACGLLGLAERGLLGDLLVDAVLGRVVRAAVLLLFLAALGARLGGSFAGRVRMRGKDDCAAAVDIARGRGERGIVDDGHGDTGADRRLLAGSVRGGRRGRAG